jgi:hypothetical protein
MMKICWENKEQISLVNKLWSIPVSASSKALVCGRSFVGKAGLNLAESRDVCLLCVVLSDRSLWDGLIPRVCNRV